MLRMIVSFINIHSHTVLRKSMKIEQSTDSLTPFEIKQIKGEIFSQSSQTYIVPGYMRTSANNYSNFSSNNSPVQKSYT